MMTRQQIMAFIQGHDQAVLATTAPEGPAADLITIAINSDLNILFQACRGSKKHRNLQQNSTVALVVGWNNGTTMQLAGKVHQPSPAELPDFKDVYYARFPEARHRSPQTEAVYYIMCPHWARYSNFNNADTKIMEMRLI